MVYVYLMIAIMCEVAATTALKAANGFTVLLPSMLVVAGYSGAFYFLSLSLSTIPLGVAYAVWSGMGIVLVSVLGWLVYHQSLDWAAIFGMLMILGGVVFIKLFSKTM